jgi:adsorption protein B
VEFDHWVAACLIALAAWILLSGLDDLFVGFVHYFVRARPFRWPRAAELDSVPERRIALFVPLWHEHRVIGRMLDRNLASIAYRNYDVFVGIYPNDPLTARAVEEAAQRHPRIHIAVCRRNGPTSKGDCLNAIYARMEEFEALRGVRFDLIVTHDAEDVIHWQSLRLINWFSRRYQMVQVPVLPLPTPAWDLTHGLYCDEFSDSSWREIQVRQRLGGFLPGTGVGTGFAREALERLAAAQGRVFDPDSLTEDYDSGYRLHALGFRQVFLPVRFDNGNPVATREYFPRSLRAAVRQRSRWVAGIALQGWSRHGWHGSPRQIYWLWRDRKGLAGNMLSPLSNLLVLYGTATWAAAAWSGTPWHLGGHIPRWLGPATGSLAVLQAAMRMHACARIYGIAFAAGVPLRMLWGNMVNSLATAEALWQFLVARLRRHALVWRKTEHVYPADASCGQGRPRLGEVLIRMRVVSLGEIDEALLNRPRTKRLGEYLLHHELITEQDLYHALSLQGEIPWGAPEHSEVDPRATRALPAAAARHWHVLPFRINSGQLHLLTADLPSREMAAALAGVSALEIRFRLVRPSELELLTAEFLP